ncbi:hypothetical protein Taro_014294 [Colocasia esculenta]|uniref:Uncharacterized protein n=1 Tax=Colocasia esculenta TaxID=4460 RepID=A0A843ULD6_COLES|nr:hypothetical protein [Colocasia esculenta]
MEGGRVVITFGHPSSQARNRNTKARSWSFLSLAGRRKESQSLTIIRFARQRHRRDQDTSLGTGNYLDDGRYPCYTGLIQAIAERYNSKWNTICTAEGETTIDLWAFHRISGLPIIGEPYEKDVLDEFYRNSIDGQGRYEIEFCYRYLMKALCDLAKARQSTYVVGDTDALGPHATLQKSVCILGSFPSHSESGQLGWFDPWTQQVVHGFAERCVRLARMWWNLFQQDDASLLVNTSSSTYRGAVTMKYANWWASHGGNFTQLSGAICHVEKNYLRRKDRPHFHIRERYLKKYFSELAIHVINAFQARDKSQKRPLAQIEVEHADTPPTLFMHVGYHKMHPQTLYSPPATINDDSAKEWIAYLNNVLTSLGPRREAFLIQRAFCLDDVWSVVSSDTVSPSRRLAQPETRVGPDISLPIPSSDVANSPHDGAEARGGHSREDDVDDWDYELDVTDIPILNSNWDPSMDNPEDPNFSIPFDDLMRMMEEPLPTIDQGALQDITAVVEPRTAEPTPFLSTEATSDQGNPLFVSTSIALHEEKTVIGQDDLSPVPDPGETNNNGGDSFVPMSPASNLPVVVKKVEVAIKPSEHLLETCVISGDHSESTEPLSGEAQQLSIAFEAACDAAEVSSHPSLAASGLDRSLQALEVLEAWLAALRSEVVGTAGQISMVRDQHTSLVSTQREKLARATLLRMLASCLDWSIAEDTQHSVALTARLLSLEAEQSKIHVTITALEAEVDLLRASATEV